MKIRALLLVGLATFSIGLSDATATPDDNATTHFMAPSRVTEIHEGYTTFTPLSFKDLNGVERPCTGTSYQWRISKGYHSHDSIHKLLLAALLSGTKVNADYELIGTVCWVKKLRLGPN